MMNTIYSWKERIVVANNTYPDRNGGSTELSRLSDELEKLDTASAEVARDAIISLINEGHCGSRDELILFWRRMSGLSRSLPNHNDESLRKAFYSRLFGKNRLGDYLLVFALNGFLICGGVLSIKEIEKLDSVKYTHLASFVHAAVVSHHLEFARRIILTVEIDSSMNAILCCLDDWREKWDSDKNFISFVKQMKCAVKQNKNKEKISKWLKRRHL